MRTSAALRARRWVLAVSACVPAALSGCRSIEGTYGVPPFYEVYDTPSTFGSGPGTDTWVRPLFGYESRLSGDRRLRIALPFVDLQWGPRGEDHWVLPALIYRNFPQPLGGRDVDWLALVLFAGGSDPEEGSYFAFFPLAGSLKGYLARDEIRFVAFPAYAWVRDGERRSAHVLWPIFNRVWGGDWSGWRLWPFFGRYRSRAPDGRLRYDRLFVLWPFYTRRRDDLLRDPTDLVFVAPFYGERVNSRSETRTYLWPFFQTHHDRKSGATTYAGYLFPFRVGPGQTDVWPFFGTKATAVKTEIGGEIRRTYREFALWPIQRYEWAEDGLEESSRLWILPFFWRFHYIRKDTLQTRSELKVWPLFEYRDGPEGAAFDLFSPLWFRREEYERSYARWFQLFRYRGGGPVGGWEILYGAVLYRTAVEPREGTFSILGGLFELGSREGKPTFRFLYVRWL